MTINFACPHCGKETNVGDQYAGQSGACSGCGESITIPSPSGPFRDAPDTPPAKSGPSVWLVLGIVGGVGCAVLLPIIGILVALLFPAINAAREAARRQVCMAQVRQIGMAMLNYEAEYGCYPPAYVADDAGRPMHSWRVLLLPYLEQSHLYEQYDFDEPWDSPANLMVAEMMPPVYACPSSDEGVGNMTGYLVVNGPGCLFDGDKATKMAEVLDGLSGTLMVVESTDSAVTWTEPTDLDASAMAYMVDGGPGEIGSLHHGGAVVLCADGGSEVLPSDTSPQDVKAMTTIDGGEPVNMSMPY